MVFVRLVLMGHTHARALHNIPEVVVKHWCNPCVSECDLRMQEHNYFCLAICASIPCQNGGTCYALNSNTQIYCQCSAGFSGSRCGTRKIEVLLCDYYFTGFISLELTNACASSPCLNNGACTNLGNSYRCTCPNPYYGTNCQFLSAGRF